MFLLFHKEEKNMKQTIDDLFGFVDICDAEKTLVQGGDCFGCNTYGECYDGGKPKPPLPPKPKDSSSQGPSGPTGGKN